VSNAGGRRGAVASGIGDGGAILIEQFFEGAGIYDAQAECLQIGGWHAIEPLFEGRGNGSKALGDQVAQQL
jgi:hypothetical protein